MIYANEVYNYLSKKRIIFTLNATRRRLMTFQAIFITLLGGASSGQQFQESIVMSLVANLTTAQLVIYILQFNLRKKRRYLILILYILLYNNIYNINIKIKS